jgi:hypothetical protein
MKKKIKIVLDKYKPMGIYYYMPVPYGFGKQTLDYLGFFCGLGFAIEAKRLGGEPNERQDVIIADIRRSGAKVFVINSDASLQVFDDWLQWCVTVRWRG